MKYVNIISPFGLGDTFILCMLKNAIEEKYCVKVRYWIKPSHVYVAEMFNADFEVRVFSEAELIELSKKSKQIEEASFFVAHPHYIDMKIEQDFFEHRIDFFEMYEKTLGLDSGKKNIINPIYPMLTDSLLSKIYPLKPDEVTLFAPEMTSCFSKMDIPSQNWLKAYMANYDTNKVVINVCKTESRVFEGRYVDLSLSELVSLAINCQEVIAVRSGLCDLIYPEVKKMSVLYANYDVFKNYSLRNLFKGIKDNDAVEERVISYENELHYRGYSNCAIYGMGENGRRLYRTLNEVSFPVLYSIDRNSKKMSAMDIDVLPTEGLHPQTDCIISTISEGYSQVKETLQKNGFAGSVINFWDMEYHNRDLELLARTVY